MKALSQEPWLYRCVSRFQCLAGEIDEGTPESLIREIRALLDAVPRKLSLNEQLWVRTLFGQALGRVISAHPQAFAMSAGQAFVALAACGFTYKQWHHRCCELIASCLASGPGVTVPASLVPRMQVTQALRVLDSKHDDPSLTLAKVADAISVSPCHLSRLLKIETGIGFVGHIHQRRVTSAQRLLTESTLSVKEVAAAVGYRSVTQFGRHFKRLRGVTPIALRGSNANRSIAS